MKKIISLINFCIIFISCNLKSDFQLSKELKSTNYIEDFNMYAGVIKSFSCDNENVFVLKGNIIDGKLSTDIYRYYVLRGDSSDLDSMLNKYVIIMDVKKNHKTFKYGYEELKIHSIQIDKNMNLDSNLVCN